MSLFSKTIANISLNEITASLPNPYPYRELLFLTIKNILGPLKLNRDIVSFLPKKTVLNNILRVEHRLGFLGDIMDTHGYPFHVDPSIQEFFLDTDLVIGNLEGIITHLPKPLFALSHTEKIIEALSRIQSPEQIALCVSNNHSSDFGHKAFQDSVNILSNNGLKIFGTKKSPSYMHTQRINIVGASMWSNKKNCSYITRFDETGQHLSKKPGCFNIFFPHWGYEIELWPRPEIIRLGYSLLDDWDMIFGHHSHVPQPITAVPKGHTNKLLAYSGGDLVTGIRFQKYRYGMIAKCTIGPIETSPESLAVGSVEWMFTHVEQCLSSKPNKRGQSGFMVKTTPSCRYFRSI